MVKAVRGAVGLDENTPEAIEEGVRACMSELVMRNKIRESDIVSILFSQTRDVTAKNPAAALRTLGYRDVPLFCTQEPEYEGSLPLTVRILLTYETEMGEKPSPVYQGRAKALRPDLSGERA